MVWWQVALMVLGTLSLIPIVLLIFGGIFVGVKDTIKPGGGS